MNHENLPRIITEVDDPWGMCFVAGAFAFREEDMKRRWGNLLSTRRLLNLCFYMQSIKTNPSTYEPMILDRSYELQR